MKRLPQIEGLRAYLAVWVLLDHLLIGTGYDVDQLPAVVGMLLAGPQAVDLFVMISGFVIFFLLDGRPQSYLSFITQRFFRLWPLFILLFAAAIPITLIGEIVTLRFSDAYPDVERLRVVALYHSWWDYLAAHVALHLPMLHGVIPDDVVPYASIAFLPAAWSISLEWQFYLIAPPAFSFTKDLSRLRAVLASLAVYALFRSSKWMPEVSFGAFLPMHIDFFYFGCASYFVFREFSRQPSSVRLFPIALAVSTAAFLIRGRISLLPYCLWAPFLCHLIDAARCPSSKVTDAVAWLFQNRVAQYLGKISYSIYLSHMIVIILVQYVLLEYGPVLSRGEHFWLLSLTSCIATVAVSHALYEFVEKPGIALGRNVADRIDRRRAAVAETAVALPLVRQPNLEPRSKAG